LIGRPEDAWGAIRTFPGRFDRPRTILEQSSNDPRTILERSSNDQAAGRSFPAEPASAGNEGGQHRVQAGRLPREAGRAVTNGTRKPGWNRDQAPKNKTPSSEGAEPRVYAAFNARNRAGVVAPRLGLPAAVAAAEVNLGNYPRLPVARRSWARAWAMVLFLISTSSALSEAEIWVLSSSCWAAPRSI